LQQLVMRPLLDNAPFVQDKQSVQASDGR
jgi:hypothetical protein